MVTEQPLPKLPPNPPIRLVGYMPATWYDMKDHRTEGTIWLYLVEGVRSGQWMISVKVHKNKKKAVVKVVGSEQGSFRHSQFWGDTKNHDFEETRNRKHLYHQLGIGYVGTDRRERKRVRSKRQSMKSTLPKQFQRYFGQLLRVHDDVSPRTGWSKMGHPMAKSLVVTVPKDRTDLMAWSYVLEKLQPLFEDKFVEPTRTSLAIFA